MKLHGQREVQPGEIMEVLTERKLPACEPSNKNE